ncbi:lipid-binding SYLF domain-containing protein [Limimaricola litoreus]|uniref:YSC84-related protein n=1 Tax=Limimaricola litoreus TaxID=2955316 RepID=A0A9X2FVR3_9RHOB|nr:YSC84-related protein [Limimaricola litoreus]MCP1168048.1 YSC84-related protein [Limimaricola litoreus]
MNKTTRRSFALGLGATGLLAACGNGVGSDGGSRIDARVQSTLDHMYDRYPGTRELAAQSKGMLVMPLMTEVGLGLGGAYGRGALMVGRSVVDYYSATTASAGLQIGAQQFSHVLFFMTERALGDFRRAPGWAAGADVEYAVNDRGEMLRAETTTSLSPVIAVVFAQTGLRVGATLEGTKYSRIIP